MELRFPRFSQGLAQDPTTRRIWFGIATAHDFESHDDITEERLYQNIFASHFGQLAIIFLWTSGNLFHVAWQGNFVARSSRLIPDKANLGFRFPCDGPGRGGTCQVSAWDHVFLGLLHRNKQC